MNKKTIDKMNEAETIGKRIRVIRGCANKSQTKFAIDLGISQSTLSAIELDRISPTADPVIKKIGEMGYDLDWLIFGTSKGNENISEIAQDWDRARVNKLMEKLSTDEVRFCRQWMELYVKSLSKDDKNDKES